MRDESTNTNRVSVPKRIHESLKQVRDSGAINMLDVSNVLDVLEQLTESAADAELKEQAEGYCAALNWVVMHRADYLQGIRDGFTIQDTQPKLHL